MTTDLIEHRRTRECTVAELRRINAEAQSRFWFRMVVVLTFSCVALIGICAFLLTMLLRKGAA